MFVLFSVRSFGYQRGCTVAAVSAQRLVEHKNAYQNFATEGTKHSVERENRAKKRHFFLLPGSGKKEEEEGDTARTKAKRVPKRKWGAHARKKLCCLRGRSKSTAFNETHNKPNLRVGKFFQQNVLQILQNSSSNLTYELILNEGSVVGSKRKRDSPNKETILPGIPAAADQFWIVPTTSGRN